MLRSINQLCANWVLHVLIVLVFPALGAAAGCSRLTLAWQLNVPCLVAMLFACLASGSTASALCALGDAHEGPDSWRFIIRVSCRLGLFYLGSLILNRGLLWLSPPLTEFLTRQLRLPIDLTCEQQMLVSKIAVGCVVSIATMVPIFAGLWVVRDDCFRRFGR